MDLFRGWGELGGAGWAALIAAPFIGSFLGLLIRRLPRGLPVAWQRSRCENCGTVLGARDLIPLVSWLGAGGRCRYCGERLGSFYPAVEISALLIAGAAFAVDRGFWGWLDCILGWWLLLLGWIDLRHWILPDVLTLPLVVTGLAAAFFWSPDELVARATGAIIGYLSLVALAALYRRIRGWEGIGRGDAKLLAAAGAWVGALGLPSVVFLAAACALAAAGAQWLAGRRLNARSALPFGPFLALATFIVYLLGPLST